MSDTDSVGSAGSDFCTEKDGGKEVGDGGKQNETSEEKDSAEGPTKSVDLGRGIVLKLNVAKDVGDDGDETAKEGRTTRSAGKQKATDQGDNDAKRRKVA
ncbi:hypothetical protein H0H93_009480 [Arthromyces matolae]|nr:hypothetical protein H0H93_009480 [Arthromyces matolae]